MLKFADGLRAALPIHDPPSPMTTQFITKPTGEKVAVVIPMREYEELMEDIVDLAAVAERRDEERVSLAEVKQHLVSDGFLPGRTDA
jgi:hypothetical protein